MTRRQRVTGARPSHADRVVLDTTMLLPTRPIIYKRVTLVSVAAAPLFATPLVIVRFAELRILFIMRCRSDRPTEMRLELVSVGTRQPWKATRLLVNPRATTSRSPVAIPAAIVPGLLMLVGRGRPGAKL